METRANHLWVGAVSLALLAALAAFIIWIARLNNADQKEYDIFFKQSVDGLAKGSEVAFSGVPAGQIKGIELWQKDPEFVRVRIKVDDNIPILQGTTASIQGSFTGVSTIQLDGAVRGAPPIVEPGPEGVPVIPTKRGGLGELLSLLHGWFGPSTYGAFVLGLLTLAIARFFARVLTAPERRDPIDLAATFAVTAYVVAVTFSPLNFSRIALLATLGAIVGKSCTAVAPVPIAPTRLGMPTPMSCQVSFGRSMR